MPIYRFHINVTLSPEAVVERLKSATRVPPSFFESLRASIRPSSAPSELFFGCVENSCFRIHRNIRYRNSFLPNIRGRISASTRGTRIDVLMYMNPFVAAFVAFCLVTASQGASAYIIAHHSILPLALLMCIILLSMGGFFPEALKAKKLLTSLWLENSPLIEVNTKVFVDKCLLDDKIKCNNCGHFNAIISSKCLYCGVVISASNHAVRVDNSVRSTP